MDNDLRMSENNGVVTEIVVEKPESQIVEKSVSEIEFTPIIADNKECDDGSMEIIESHISEASNSLLLVSKNNDDETEQTKNVDSTESASIPIQSATTNGDDSLPAIQSVATCRDESLAAIQPVATNGNESLAVIHPVATNGDESLATIQPNPPNPENNSEKNVRSDVETAKTIEIVESVSSLSVIALAYENSDSEGEDCKIVATAKNFDVSNAMEVQITKEYRNVPATIEDDSDSDDSSSVVSSVVSLSEAESDCAENNSDDSGNTRKKNNKNNGRKTDDCRKKECKGEYDDLLPIEELKISVPEVLCDPLGEVAWMVEQMVVVRPKPGKPTLNIDTVLFVERGRRVLGRIFDVFGQVSDPHYCVRFNSSEHIQQSDIKVGMTAYFCPNTEYTSVVFLQDLLKMKATDELGDDEHPEFSDDEEERAYYAALKQKQKSERAKTNESVPQKRQRTDPGWKSNHPWSSVGRKKDHNKKIEKNYKSAILPNSEQQNPRDSSNTWQRQQQQQQQQQRQSYPAVHGNILWPPSSESYQRNVWPSSTFPPPNSYGYSETFQNHPPPGNPRSFFRPPRGFQTGPMGYGQNIPYSPQSNSSRFSGMNFSWQSPVPGQSSPSWRFPPPPPPPPPGM